MSASSRSDGIHNLAVEFVHTFDLRDIRTLLTDHGYDMAHSPSRTKQICRMQSKRKEVMRASGNGFLCGKRNLNGRLTRVMAVSVRSREE